MNIYIFTRHSLVRIMSMSLSLVMMVGLAPFQLAAQSPTVGTLTIEKVVTGTSTVPADDFSFQVNGGAAVTFEVDGSNEIELPLGGPYSIVEVEADGPGYETTYSASCSNLNLTAGGATCVITNDFLATSTPVDGCIDPAAINYEAAATIDDGSCLYELTVLKEVLGSSSPQYDLFSITINGTATTTLSGPTTTLTVSGTSSHTIREVEAAGFSVTYLNCSNVNVDAYNSGDHCTIINEQNDNNGPGACTVEIFSDEETDVVGATTEIVTANSSAWDSILSPAKWIWGDQDTDALTFITNFNFIGNVTTAFLHVLFDGNHSAELNGNDPYEWDTSIYKTHLIDPTDIQQGNNQLVITASGTDPDPQGIKYKLVINGEVTTTDDCSIGGGGGGGNDDTFRVYGYVWDDDNGNREWEGFDEEDVIEGPLIGWTVNITNGQNTYSTTTDSDGYYYFDVPEGTWTISQIIQNGWSETTEGPYEVMVTASPQVSLVDRVMNFFIPTAHAQAAPTFGPYNFGNRQSSGGGGGGGNNDDDDNGGDGGGATRVGGRGGGGAVDDGDNSPQPLVLGEQVSAVPIGAPNTGHGGTAPFRVDRQTYSWSAILRLSTYRD